MRPCGAPPVVPPGLDQDHARRHPARPTQYYIYVVYLYQIKRGGIPSSVSRPVPLTDRPSGAAARA